MQIFPAADRRAISVQVCACRRLVPATFPPDVETDNAEEREAQKRYSVAGAAMISLSEQQLQVVMDTAAAINQERTQRISRTHRCDAPPSTASRSRPRG
jgi:hypothetical protein